MPDYSKMTLGDCVRHSDKGVSSRANAIISILQTPKIEVTRNAVYCLKQGCGKEVDPHTSYCTEHAVFSAE